MNKIKIDILYRTSLEKSIATKKIVSNNPVLCTIIAEFGTFWNDKSIKEIEKSITKFEQSIKKLEKLVKNNF